MRQTQHQQEEMKKQTFGVEIEMYGITRKTAAKEASRFFHTTRTHRYLGDSYRTWKCEDREGRTWKFERDISIRADSDEEKCEMVTPILTYADIETLQELVRTLRKKGAKSDPAHGCGVHIHIGAEGHTPATLRNLTNLMASHESLLTAAIGIDGERRERFCKTVDPRFLKAVNEKKPSTMAKLADIWYTSQDCDCGRDHHYNRSRYHMLNLHAVFTKGTVEFRLFQFQNPDGEKKNGLHAGELKAYIQLCLALNQMAKDSKKISAKPQQTENPKFAMRTWLMRMGFIGEEFATGREVLTKRLSGNGAFRRSRNAAA